MRLAPAVRLLLHILLKLDPARRLLPLQLLVLVHHQLIQLHEHLPAQPGQCRHSGDPPSSDGVAHRQPPSTMPRARRTHPAAPLVLCQALAPLLCQDSQPCPPPPPGAGTLHLMGLPVLLAVPRAGLLVVLADVDHLRLGALPDEVPAHPRHILEAVTCRRQGGQGRQWVGDLWSSQPCAPSPGPGRPPSPPTGRPGSCGLATCPGQLRAEVPEPGLSRTITAPGSTSTAGRRSAWEGGTGLRAGERCSTGRGPLVAASPLTSRSQGGSSHQGHPSPLCQGLRVPVATRVLLRAALPREL